MTVPLANVTLVKIHSTVVLAFKVIPDVSPLSSGPARLATESSVAISFANLPVWLLVSAITSAPING